MHFSKQRLSELENRVVSARGQIKVVAAALVAVVGLGAAVWAYSATRNERNFDRKDARGGLGMNVPPEQRKQMQEAAKVAAEEEEKKAAPRQYQTVTSKDGTSALTNLPEKIAAAIQASPEAGNVTSADQSALADRTRIALEGMIAGSPEALNQSIVALGGTPRENDPSKPIRRNPLPKLLEGAQLDMANIAFGAPSMRGMPGGAPTPGSGQFRVTAEDTQTVTKDNLPPGVNIPPGATVRTIRANPGETPGDGSPAAAPGVTPGAAPGTAPQQRMNFGSLISMRTDSFPAVRDYASQNLPAYEVKVPAKLKDSTNTTPDMEIGVIMAQTPEGLWQPAAYNLYPKSPDVQTQLMNLILSAAKEQGAKIKTSFGDADAEKGEHKPSDKPTDKPLDSTK